MARIGRAGPVDRATGVRGSRLRLAGTSGRRGTSTRFVGRLGGTLGPGAADPGPSGEGPWPGPRRMGGATPAGDPRPVPARGSIGPPSDRTQRWRSRGRGGPPSDDGSESVGLRHRHPRMDRDLGATCSSVISPFGASAPSWGAAAERSTQLRVAVAPPDADPGAVRAGRPMVDLPTEDFQPDDGVRTRGVPGCDRRSRRPAR